jgi:hypothetical protein
MSSDQKKRSEMETNRAWNQQWSLRLHFDSLSLILPVFFSVIKINCSSVVSSFFLDVPIFFHSHFDSGKNRNNKMGLWWLARIGPEPILLTKAEVDILYQNETLRPKLAIDLAHPGREFGDWVRSFFDPSKMPVVTVKRYVMEEKEKEEEGDTTIQHKEVQVPAAYVCVSRFIDTGDVCIRLRLESAGVNEQSCCDLDLDAMQKTQKIYEAFFVELERLLSYTPKTLPLGLPPPGPCKDAEAKRDEERKGKNPTRFVLWGEYDGTIGIGKERDFPL